MNTQKNVSYAIYVESNQTIWLKCPQCGDFYGPFLDVKQLKRKAGEPCAKCQNLLVDPPKNGIVI